MTITQALFEATRKLRLKKIATASLDAEVLLSFVFKKNKVFLYTYPERDVLAKHLKKYRQLIARRTKLEPVAYLTNSQAFYGLDFYVDRRVLIPRPETELIIDEIIGSIRNQKLGIKNQKLTIADIGTGSGCIAIAIKKNLPSATVYGLDRATAALRVAKKNARRHHVKINWHQGNLLTPVKDKPVDILVANLPYLTADQYRTNRGLRFEPRGALVADQKGLGLYQQLFEQLNKAATKPRLIICEIDPRQTRAMMALSRRHFPAAKRIIKKDLAGRNRFCLIEQPKK